MTLISNKHFSKKATIMKFIFTLLFCGFSVSYAAPTPGLILGTYKAIDAYCSKPDYVFPKEEKDFIDNIKGLTGSCIDGKFTSPPCFEDYYVFTTETKGAWVTRILDIKGVSCILSTEVTYSESPVGTLNFRLGKTTSLPVSTDPNTEINCGARDEGSEVSFQYQQENNSLFLKAPHASEKCGEFIFKTISVNEVPK